MRLVRCCVTAESLEGGARRQCTVAHRGTQVLIILLNILSHKLGFVNYLGKECPLSTQFIIVESPDCAEFLVSKYLLPSSLIVHCADQCRAPSGHLGWSYHNSPLWLDNKLLQAFSQNLFKVI